MCTHNKLFLFFENSKFTKKIKADLGSMKFTDPLKTEILVTQNQYFTSSKR